jgi:hypothetical protein
MTAGMTGTSSLIKKIINSKYATMMSIMGLELRWIVPTTKNRTSWSKLSLQVCCAYVSALMLIHTILLGKKLKGLLIFFSSSKISPSSSDDAIEVVWHWWFLHISLGSVKRVGAKLPAHQLIAKHPCQYTFVCVCADFAIYLWVFKQKTTQLSLSKVTFLA